MPILMQSPSHKCFNRVVLINDIRSIYVWLMSKSYLLIINNKLTTMNPYGHYPPLPEQHIHYHYHYHYDQPSSSPSPKSSIPNPHKNPRMLSPRTYASSIETNYWKQHVNPEVSRLYHTLHPRHSRLSENYNRISEEDSIIQEVTGTGTKNRRLLETECEEDTTFGQRRPLSKLESLYYSKQAGTCIQEVESINSEKEDAFFSIHEEKLRRYKRQIERLKSMQEQCEYLRQHFMLHIEAKHKDNHS